MKKQVIVACTNKSLSLPLIPSSFIERWVEKQGKIDKVRLQTEIVTVYDARIDEEYSKKRLKLVPFPANEVIILPMDKMYSREDIVKIHTDYMIHKYYPNPDPDKSDYDKVAWEFYEWFDKNY